MLQKKVQKLNISETIRLKMFRILAAPSGIGLHPLSTGET